MRSLLICIAMLFAQQASAAVTINIIESGGNVEATLSGSIDMGALIGPEGTFPSYNGYLPELGAVAFTAGLTDVFGISAATWAPFGPGNVFDNWDSSTGDAFALWTNPALGLPVGYVSGSPLSATAVKNGSSFAALGFVPGTYVTTLSAPEGSTDTVTVKIGPDDPFVLAISNETTPSVPEGLGGYTADGSFLVSITDGASCTGTTYDISATPVAGSSPLGNTPLGTVPTTIIDATAAGGPYVFTAGAGTYDVSVTETGPCFPAVNPEVTTATVPDMPSADLLISKVADRDTAIAGDPQPLVYTVTVTNNGPSDAMNVIVLDTLPLGVSNPVTVGCLEDPAGAAACSLGIIPATASAAYTVSVDVDASTLGEIINQVSVSSDTIERDPESNSASVSTTVEASADLSISKIADRDTAIAGDGIPLVYTITVTNNGPSDALNVSVIDTLPLGVSNPVTVGCLEDPAGAAACSLGHLAVDASASYTVSVDVDASTLGVIVNEVTVSSETDDPDETNNTAQEETLVEGLADMSITKLGSSDVIESGGNSVLTYTIEVSNAGPSDALDVNVNDILPSLAVFESTSGCNNDPDGVPDCDLGTVVVGGSAMYTIDVTLQRADSVITNTAEVSASTDDPDLSNNVASVETELRAISIPVNANWALMLMVLLLGGFGWTAIRRR